MSDSEISRVLSIVARERRPRVRGGTGMRKRLAMWVSIASLCAISFAAFSQDRVVVRSACEYSYPPFCLVSQDGVAGGFSVELLRAALHAVDQDVSFEVGEWGVLKSALAAGTLDTLPLVGRTPEREEIYDFTFPYLTLHGAIFVRKGDTRIKTVADLADKEVLVLAGDNAEEYARRENLTSHLIPIATYAEAMRLLIAGKHDAVLAQHLMGVQLLRQMEVDTVIPSGVLVAGLEQNFCFAVQEGNSELLSALNEGLAVVMADGTFDRLHEEWFGAVASPAMTLAQIGRTVVSVAFPLIFMAIAVSVVVLRRTVRKKTEALNRANQEWEKTFDATPDMIAIIDPAFKIVRVNAAMAERLGVQPRDTIGKACHEVVHGTTCPHRACPFQSLVEDGAVHTEEIYEERLGGHCVVSTSPLLSPHGQLTGCVHVVRDVNAQKKVEEILSQRVAERSTEVERKSEDLAEAERKYRIVADFTSDWEYWELPDGSMAYVSPSCESVSGYSADEFVQRPELLDEIVDPVDKALWLDHRCGRKDRAAPEALRFRIQTKQGETCWIEHACQQVEEEGVFLGFRVSNRDISERQAAHIERNALRSQIAHISRVTAMGELTAALAHEINQPLGAILSNAQAAVRFLGHAEPDMQEVREALDAIVDDDKRAGEIVRRLRRMVSAGTPEYEATRMRDVIDEVISLVQSELILNHVNLDKQMMSEVIEVACDRVQIQQVLLNLITNAIDSMKQVPRAERVLRIRMAREGDHEVTVSVRDSGAGMDAESIESVFTPFYTTKKTGMGMGLAISRSIIELHKGTLQAERNRGNGMKFWFTVPRERGAE